MTHPRDHLPVLDRVEVALEATCDALMTLQSIDALARIPAGENGKGHIARAISHLRHAVDELRDAQAAGQTGLALGSVEPTADRIDCCLDPAGHTELGQDIRDVIFCRAGADRQRFGDVGILHPSGDQSEHVEFAS